MAGIYRKFVVYRVHTGFKLKKRAHSLAVAGPGILFKKFKHFKGLRRSEVLLFTL